RHRPWRERIFSARKSQAAQSRSEIPRRDDKHRARERAARGEEPEAEYELPKSRQHPKALRRKSVKHGREQRTCDPGRYELLGCRIDHLVGETRMDPARAGHHLYSDQPDGNRGGCNPQGEIAQYVVQWIRKPERL